MRNRLALTTTVRWSGLLLAVCLLLPAAAASAASQWKPGAPHYQTEAWMNDVLEQRYDRAFCDGIPRFGKRGQFPYDQYIVFDCDTKRNGRYCVDARWKAVNSTKQGFVLARRTVKPRCY